MLKKKAAHFNVDVYTPHITLAVVGSD